MRRYGSVITLREMRTSSIVGPGSVLTQAEDVLPYSFDGTAALRQRPAAVVFPRTVDDVAKCVRFAAEHALPIVTRGSGTGLPLATTGL